MSPLVRIGLAAFSFLMIALGIYLVLRARSLGLQSVNMKRVFFNATIFCLVGCCALVAVVAPGTFRAVSVTMGTLLLVDVVVAPMLGARQNRKVGGSESGGGWLR